MDHLQEEDLIRVKELLQHTGEFIAYFELAETKMIEWREEIESQSSQLYQRSQIVHNEIASVHELLSQAGITRFRTLAQKALSQGEIQLQVMENTCKQFTEHFEEQQEKLSFLTHQCLLKIEEHTTKSTQDIASQLAKYDVHQFHRIAHESCDHVERAASNAVNKSQKLLHMFQMRSGLLGVFTTLISAFVIVLYLSGELPWDLHQKAVKERDVGKALLRIWPSLTLEEKTRILSNEGLPHGG
jgi:hypothetical protein